MPTRYEWITFDNWKEIYGRLHSPSWQRSVIIWANFAADYLAGPILSLSVLGQSITVLCTVDSANLLLDKHSAINSDRPQLQMAGKL
jgi:hypothetical protein